MFFTAGAVLLEIMLIQHISTSLGISHPAFAFFVIFFFLLLKSHEQLSCTFTVFIISKDKQSPNTAEYKEQKKREKQRLEREKKEQKERERKDNEMKKKFKVCSSKSPLLKALPSLEINYWSFSENHLRLLHSALLEQSTCSKVLDDASFSCFFFFSVSVPTSEKKSNFHFFFSRCTFLKHT